MFLSLKHILLKRWISNGLVHVSMMVWVKLAEYDAIEQRKVEVLNISGNVEERQLSKRKRLPCPI